LQVLEGDNTDNIPGIHGVGKVKSRKLLADVPDEGLAIECLNIWTEYLESDRKLPIDDMLYDSQVGVISYVPWFAPLDDSPDNWVNTSAEYIMHEVYNLVKVGGEHAEKAAEDSGEALLLPR